MQKKPRKEWGEKPPFFLLRFFRFSFAFFAHLHWPKAWHRLCIVKLFKTRLLFGKSGRFTRPTHTNILSLPSPTPPGWPPSISIFFALDSKFPGWGLLTCQIPRSGDEKRGQMPRPPPTLQHFSLIAQSNNAVLSILKCDFLFQLTSSFIIALGS